MATITVAQAEMQLAAARDERAKQKREDAKQEIKRLRREGAALLKQLRPMAAQVKAAQHERLALNGELVHARNQIEAYRLPLDPTTFPTDEEVAARAEQLALWKARQKELLAKAAAAAQREAIRPQAVALQNRLQHLQYEIQNLTAIAEGRMPGQTHDTGLHVSENFIGNMQSEYSGTWS